MTHVSDLRPSGEAGRIALIACAAALLGMLLFPLATLGRGFSADAVLLHLSGSVLNLSANQDAHIPATGPVIALGWAALVLLAATLYGALRRTTWFWITGLLAALVAALDVILLNNALNGEVTRLLTDSTMRPGAKRQLRNFYASGGMNMGLFLPILSGLISAGAGLTGRPVWWERFNRLRGLLVPISALSLAIVVGAIVVLIVQPPVNQSGQPLSLWGGWLAKSDLVYFVYSSLFAPVTNLNLLMESLKLATPLIFTGLSVAFAFRTGLFNVGAPGQLIMGAICAMLVGVYGPTGLGWFLAVLSVLAAAAGGALWGAIPGLLKARFGSSEVINTIMLNYISYSVLNFMLGGDTFPFLGKTYHLPFKAPGFEPKSHELPTQAQLPPLLQVLNVGHNGQTAISIGWICALVGYLVSSWIFRKATNRTIISLGVAAVLGALTWMIGIPVTVTGSQLNVSFLIALLCVLLFGTLMWRTSTGYALRAVGLSPKAAEYGGISVARNTVLAMTLAGMFAGLAGTHYVNGGALDEYKLKVSMPASVGFDGMAVALMGQSTPTGVVAASLLFGTVDTGGVNVQTLNNVSKDLVLVLKALIVLFIAAGGFLSRRITDPPPPQLVAATDKTGHPDEAHLSRSVAASEKATPLPNIGQRAEGQSLDHSDRGQNNRGGGQ